MAPAAAPSTKEAKEAVPSGVSGERGCRRFTDSDRRKEPEEGKRSRRKMQRSPRREACCCWLETKKPARGNRWGWGILIDCQI